MIYRENYKDADKYKMQYLDGIEALISKLSAECEKKRDIYATNILSNQEKYRKDFAELLGWPLTENMKRDVPNAIVHKLSEEDCYSLYRVQLEVLDGLTLTGLLFKQHQEEACPLVIAQHGLLGSPELIGGCYGITGNYNDMVSRILAYGVNVFAPQLLLWSTADDGVAYDRQVLDAKLKLVGSSITALEVYSIMQCIDYFETQSWVRNIGMAGMSYGGFYTQFMAALDTRIKAAVSCSFFCDSRHWVQPDRCFNGIEKFFGEAEIACLVYPRKLYLEMGTEDPLFDYQKSLNEYERIRKICGDDYIQWVELTVFEGKHEFYKEDTHIKKMLDCLWQE